MNSKQTGPPRGGRPCHWLAVSAIRTCRGTLSPKSLPMPGTREVPRLERRGFLNRDEGDRILVAATLAFRWEVCPELTVLNFMCFEFYVDKDEAWGYVKYW